MMKMMNDHIPFQNENLTKKYKNDAGLDIRCPYNAFIPSMGKTIINTHLHITIPPGFVGIIKGRSSLALKHDIECCNAGVIDSGYTGIIRVLLRNFGYKVYEIQEGDRIAQLLTIPVNLSRYTETNEIRNTSRGNNGIGSSGK